MKTLLAPTLLLALVTANQAHAQVSADAPAKPAGGVEELVVVARTPASQTLIDRKVYGVSRDLLATSGSAAEVLNTVPSVVVDADGNPSVRGDANVTILVDGKPSSQFSGATRGLSLMQFPASDIERIEVLTNPPAQFKAEGGGGVINIITKKTRKPGWSGVAQLSVGADRRYVSGLSGAYNTGKLKLSGGVGLRQDAKERVTTSTRTALDPLSNSLAASQQTIDEHFRRLIPSVKGDVQYDLNDHQSIGGGFSHRELTGGRFFNQHDFSGPVGRSPTSISDRHSDGHEWSVDASQELRFEQKLWRPSETLSLSLQRSVTRERERYAYRNTFVSPSADPAFDDLHLSLDLVKTQFGADYALPLSNDRELKLGYGFEDDRNAFDNRGDDISPATGRPVVNPAVTNSFRYRQKVNAVYGQYLTPVGPWRVQAGLRVEAADVSTLQITGNIPGGRRDFGVYPSLSLERSLIGSAKLTATVSRRITRPDPEALNPFSDYQDTHNLRAGNPDLAPQDTWSYEVGSNLVARSQTLGATAYYRADRNSVTDVIRPLSADVVLVTKANLPRSRSGGLEFSASGKLLAKLSYSFSGDLFYSQVDATALGASSLRSTTGLNLKASLDYRPTSSDTMQISIVRTDKRLTSQGELGAIDLVNLGYRHQLRPDLAAVFTATDVFDGQRSRRFIETPQLQDEYVRFQPGKVAYVGLVYSFGAQKKAKASSFEYPQ